MTLLKALFSWLLYFGILAGIVFAGWDQPLSYHFMSAQEIAALNPPPATPTPRPHPSQWSPRGTSLDRAPYTTDNDGVTYSGNIDMRKMGTRTEQDRRPNLFNGTGGSK